MQAAIVVEPGKPPLYANFPEPVPTNGELPINVSTAALSNVVKSRASGTHYSSSNQFPFVVGIDGVGRLENGQRVYFILPKAPFGSMSERTVIQPAQCIALPAELDDVTAAAIANPGMSSWAALRERAHFLPGESVLVNGATGTAGRLAIQIAKYMGAEKVVATGRNEEALTSLLRLGADAAIPIGDNPGAFEDALKTHFANGIDVVLDYLWGPSAERVITAAAKAGKEAQPIRFVQIGSVAASDITLPSSALRSSALTLMGSGINSVPLPRLLQSIDDLFHAALPGRFEVATRVFPLSDVEKVWSTSENMPRAVFQIA